MVCQYPEPGGIWIDFGLDALRGLTMECPSFRRGECFVDNLAQLVVGETHAPCRSVLQHVAPSQLLDLVEKRKVLCRIVGGEKLVFEFPPVDGRQFCQPSGPRWQSC